MILAISAECLEGGAENILAAAKRHPEEIAALYTLLLDERLGCLTAADIVMDGGVIASGVSGLFLLILFTSSKFQKAFHVNIPTISPTITALLQ